jgi:hypothetical protein
LSVRVLVDRQQDDLHDIQKTLAGEWLLHEQVASGFETAALVVPRIFPGEEYNRDTGSGGIFLECVADIIPIHHRQHDIQQNQVGLELFRALNSAMR